MLDTLALIYLADGQGLETMGNGQHDEILTDEKCLENRAKKTRLIIDSKKFHGCRRKNN
jgi:hypothetical protein